MSRCACANMELGCAFGVVALFSDVSLRSRLRVVPAEELGRAYACPIQYREIRHLIPMEQTVHCSSYAQEEGAEAWFFAHAGRAHANCPPGFSGLQADTLPH